MLATVALEKYTRDDAHAVASALDAICSPTDTLGWASSGVYAFWNVATREILYIGLATTLATRFRQHNGLIQCDPKACKSAQIASHLQTHQEIGFSIALQSPLDQPLVVAAARELYHPEGGSSHFEITRTDPIIQQSEAALIEAYRVRHGRRPAWNAVDGGKAGRRLTSAVYGSILDLLTGCRDSAIIAKSTIRELATLPLVMTFEEHLHAARVRIVAPGGMHRLFNKLLRDTGQDAGLNDDPDIMPTLLAEMAKQEPFGVIGGYVRAMHEQEYFNKRCVLVNTQ